MCRIVYFWQADKTSSVSSPQNFLYNKSSNEFCLILCGQNSQKLDKQSVPPYQVRGLNCPCISLKAIKLTWHNMILSAMKPRGEIVQTSEVLLLLPLYSKCRLFSIYVSTLQQAMRAAVINPLENLFLCFQGQDSDHITALKTAPALGFECPSLQHRGWKRLSFGIFKCYCCYQHIPLLHRLKDKEAQSGTMVKWFEKNAKAVSFSVNSGFIFRRCCCKGN